MESTRLPAALLGEHFANSRAGAKCPVFGTLVDHNYFSVTKKLRQLDSTLKLTSMLGLPTRYNNDGSHTRERSLPDGRNATLFAQKVDSDL